MILFIVIISTHTYTHTCTHTHITFIVKGVLPRISAINRCLASLERKHLRSKFQDTYDDDGDADDLLSSMCIYIQTHTYTHTHTHTHHTIKKLNLILTDLLCV